MGPLLYAVYINEMIESVRRDDCVDEAHNNNGKLW